MIELPPNLPRAWTDARERAASQDYNLNGVVLDALFELFLHEYAGGESTPAGLTLEYNQDEFLLVVGEEGQPGGMGESLLARFEQMVNAHSEFGRWFQTGAVKSGASARERPGAPVLLAGRWLCHLVGLRHRTVEIFLDLDGAGEGHTLAQVRGMDKVISPGAFDLPCAGHVSGTETPEEALRHELSEELNLALGDLADLRKITEHAAAAHPIAGTHLINPEYCYLYRAKIRPAEFASIRFSDGEVAGLALVNLAEIRAMSARFPERVAGGLSESLVYYE